MTPGGFLSSGTSAVPPPLPPHPRSRHHSPPTKPATKSCSWTLPMLRPEPVPRGWGSPPGRGPRGQRCGVPALRAPRSAPAASKRCDITHRSLKAAQGPRRHRPAGAGRVAVRAGVTAERAAHHPGAGGTQERQEQHRSRGGQRATRLSVKGGKGRAR